MVKKAAFFVFALGISGFCEAEDLPLGAYRESMGFEEKIGGDKSGGSPRRSQIRTRYVVPTQYGRLVDVSNVDTGTSLWFEGTDGMIRNVLVGDQELVAITRK